MGDKDTLMNFKDEPQQGQELRNEQRFLRSRRGRDFNANVSNVCVRAAEYPELRRNYQEKTELLKRKRSHSTSASMFEADHDHAHEVKGKSPHTDVDVDLVNKDNSESKETSSSPTLVSNSFLTCVICCQTPPGPPLFGCDASHIVCTNCREMGGALLSCPRCGSTDLNNRQIVAEELLMTELDKNRLVFCPYKSVGCNKVTRTQLMSQHRESCLFRPVKCPKGMFSLSCTHIGPLCTIQQHARDKHNLHHGVTFLQPGLISSKMFDKSPERTCCDDKSNAKFQPLELQYKENLFYCYFERVADRRLWFFFIRMFGREEQSRGFEGSIMIGHSSMERGDFSNAGLKYHGSIAYYGMRREEIRDQGYVLAVPDEYLKSCKVGNVLFRVWFQVKETSS